MCKSLAHFSSWSVSIDHFLHISSVALLGLQRCIRCQFRSLGGATRLPPLPLFFIQAWTLVEYISVDGGVPALCLWLIIDRECRISYDSLKGCLIATSFLSIYSYAYLDTSCLWRYSFSLKSFCYARPPHLSTLQWRLSLHWLTIKINFTN